MRGLIPLLLVMSACEPVEAVVGGFVADTADTGAVNDTGVDTGSDTTDTGADTQTDTGTPPPPPPDFSLWEGERVFDFPSVYGGDRCEEVVEESGRNVEGEIDYAGAYEVCPQCDHVFVVEVTPDRLCAEHMVGSGFPVTSPVIRGLELKGDGEVDVYTIRYGSWSGWRVDHLASGALADNVLTYSYEGSVYGSSFTATGTVDF